MPGSFLHVLWLILTHQTYPHPHGPSTPVECGLLLLPFCLISFSLCSLAQLSPSWQSPGELLPVPVPLRLFVGHLESIIFPLHLCCGDGVISPFPTTVQPETSPSQRPTLSCFYTKQKLNCWKLHPWCPLSSPRATEQLGSACGTFMADPTSWLSVPPPTSHVPQSPLRVGRVGHRSTG
jgi:hypothetical protein